MQDYGVKGEVVKTTRLALYRKYQRVYNEVKEKMETTINEKRSNLTRDQYEHWFVGAYPVLQSEVEGAYLDWQVVGNKDTFEFEKSRLDTSSPIVELLDAKSTLRASGFTSLDRIQTVYFGHLSQVTGMKNWNSSKFAIYFCAWQYATLSSALCSVSFVFMLFQAVKLSLIV